MPASKKSKGKGVKTKAEKPIALYARCSTGDQDVEVQLVELRAYAERLGAEAIEFVDSGVSGRKDRRPGLDAMMQACHRREVSAVVVVRLDRLARSLAHMARLGEELRELGVDLVSLREAIDTHTSTGRAMFGMCAVFAQLEADLIRERVVAGLVLARRRGKRLGRPRAVRDPRLLARIKRLHAKGHSLRAIGAQVDIGYETVRRLISE
jgi:DNA invertase Pin-like site-specific DNA recombinase